MYIFSFGKLFSRLRHSTLTSDTNLCLYYVNKYDVDYVNQMSLFSSHVKSAQETHIHTLHQNNFWGICLHLVCDNNEFKSIL